MSIVRTPVGEVAYSERGSGPALVLLHATLHDRHDYDGVVEALAERHRTIALDWPWHGGSPAASAGHVPSAPLFADVLEHVLDALELERASFIGNSVGGFAAARLAIRRPDRVAGLVLVDNGGFAPANLATRGFCRAMGTPAVARRLLPRFIDAYMQPATELDREIARRAAARARTREGAAVAASMWRSFAAPEHDLRASARDLEAPTLILWGAKDRAIPLRVGRATHAAIAGSRLEVLDTGHVVFASEPDAFLSLAAPFLEELAGAGRRPSAA